MEKLENIIFDNEDKNLFLIDDLRLKADAIRYSILPKMEVVINYAINQIDKIYGVNVFDDCSIAKSPSFRLSNRKSEIKINYKHANVRIKGQRKYGKWKGIKKLNQKEPKIAPYSLGIELNEEGLIIFVDNQEQFVSNQSNKKIFAFLNRYESLINVIQQSARVFTEGNQKYHWHIISNKDLIKTKLNNNDFRMLMLSDAIAYPIGHTQLSLIIDRLSLLYPVFHSYLQIAKGEKIIFKKLIQKVNDWLLEEVEEKIENKKQENHIVNLESFRLKAEAKIKVMPGIRWQVFQRDNWRCVACGRSSEEGIILHVDHIMPRSKGGRDELDNYQTLCNVCNIGKSNKDETDLRKAQ